MSEADKRTPA